MSKLRLTIATSDYDHTRDLRYGEVKVEGCDVTFIDLEPEEMFHRALHFEEFDATELSFSNYLTLTARGSDATLRALELGAVDYVAKPAFDIEHSLQDYSIEITDKIRAASVARIRHRAPVGVGQGRHFVAEFVDGHHQLLELTDALTFTGPKDLA